MDILVLIGDLMRCVILCSAMIVFSSCERSKPNCDWENDIYNTSYADHVKSWGREHEFAATYFIQTDKRRILIRPVSAIIDLIDVGDSLFKPMYSTGVEVWRNGELQAWEGITSSTCDSHLIRKRS